MKCIFWTLEEIWPWGPYPSQQNITLQYDFYQHEYNLKTICSNLKSIFSNLKSIFSNLKSIFSNLKSTVQIWRAFVQIWTEIEQLSLTFDHATCQILPYRETAWSLKISKIKMHFLKFTKMSESWHAFLQILKN